jgi:hypothetical protein
MNSVNDRPLITRPPTQEGRSDRDVTMYRIKNHLEDIEFNGLLIAEASTERVDDPRWTEIQIYRTDGGQYVVHRVGRSVVYHVADGPCNFGVTTLGARLPEDAEPCRPRNKRFGRSCEPPARDDPHFDPDAAYEMELDLHSADVCSATEVPRRLSQSRGGTESMSSVSHRALRVAIETDPDLRAALTAQIRRVD